MTGCVKIILSNDRNIARYVKPPFPNSIQYPDSKEIVHGNNGCWRALRCEKMPSGVIAPLHPDVHRVNDKRFLEDHAVQGHSAAVFFHASGRRPQRLSPEDYADALVSRLKQVFRGLEGSSNIIS